MNRQEKTIGFPEVLFLEMQHYKIKTFAGSKEGGSHSH